MGELKTSGFELDFKYLPIPNWTFLGSFSHQKNENGEGLENWTLAPRNFFKLGISYSNRVFSLGIFDNSYGGFRDNVVRFPGRLALNPDSESYDWLTAKLSYTFRWNRGDLSLWLYVENILEETIYTPEMSVSNINTTPEDPGTQYYLGAKLQL